MARTAEALVAEAAARVERLVPSEVAAELAGDDADDVVLVDVREEDELRVHGWIAESVWAPRGMLEFWADRLSPHHRAEFDPGRRVILYCASGARSALAADTLRQLGYRRVAHLDGGLTAWKKDGRPVEVLDPVDEQEGDS